MMGNKLICKEGGRLDQVLSNDLSITRNKAQKIIRQGVSVNGRKVYKTGLMVKAGQEIAYTEYVEPSPDFTPKDIKFDIVYQDDDILVINKPRGLVVHPAAGHKDDTLANGLAYFFHDDDKETDQDFRMGLVHRIDKDTSGLLVVAKTIKARDYLVKQISSHLVKRQYLCLAYGNFKDKLFKVSAPIGRDKYNRKKMAVNLENGKEAVTHFEVIRQFKECALVKCSLETGRTHQIRVHLQYCNHPIVGDSLYCSRTDKNASKGQLLHAFKLSFIHPTSKKMVQFYAPVDQYFRENIKRIAEGK